MMRLRGNETRPWGLVGVSIVALILAIGTVGIVGVVQNAHVKEAAERAIQYDVAVADVGDDLRVAVLDLRDHHRNIVFSGPSEERIANFDAAYATLVSEIDRLEQIGIADLDVPQPDEFRELAREYHDDFRPSIVLFTSDPIAFNDASDTGLARIEQLDDLARQVDKTGERLTGESLERVEDAAARERIILISLLCGVALVGVALSISSGRVVNRLQTANAHEQEAGRRLAAALRAKSDFIADASHELRTPLTLIRGNAEIAVSSSRDHKDGHLLEEILRESTRMSRLVDDLLLLARSDAGTIPLEREYVPVRWLLARIGPSAGAMTRHYGQGLALDLRGDGHLEVDPQRVEQAISIAVDNASKFAPEGSCVAVRSHSDNGRLTFEVIDSGPGIPPEELPLVFERFYQVGERRARRKGGSGLGLAIAKSIIEAHDGTIGIDSAVGRGTTVTIRLPLAEAQ